LLIIPALDATEQQKKDLSEAIDYLKRSPTGFRVVSELEKSPTEYAVDFNNSDKDQYSSKTKRIDWDPLSGLKTGKGEIQTPALGLGHEFGHALQDQSGRLAGRTRAQIEAENLANTESPIAKELGEPIRGSYGDVDPYNPTPKTDGPTSCRPYGGSKAKPIGSSIALML
jgi:hypothetical protein